MDIKHPAARSWNGTAHESGIRRTAFSRSLAVCLAAVLLPLGGCASTLGAIYNRPVVEDNAEKAISTISLSADRRTVIVVTDGVNRGKFCAEPPPDTALSLTTELKAQAQAAAKQAQIDANASGTVEDKLTTTVSVLSKRTTSLEGYRIGSYSLCQLHLIGALSTGEVAAQLKALTEMFFKSLAEGAGETDTSVQSSATTSGT